MAISHTTQSLKILSVEDAEDEFDLQIDVLRRAELSVSARRTGSLGGFERALRKDPPDLVLCDYRMNDFTGFDVIRLSKKIRPDIPVILISGTVGEDVAVKSLALGADDYLLKSNLRRLPNAVRKAVVAARADRDRRCAESQLREREAALRHAQSMARIAYSVWSAKTNKLISSSDNLPEILGQTEASMPRRLEDSIPWVAPEDRVRVASAHRGLKRGGRPLRLEYRLLRKDGSSIMLAETIEWNPPENGGSGSWFITVQDVTANKLAERNLKLLVEIGQAVAPADTFEAALSAALLAICTRTGFGYGDAWVPTADGERLVVSPAWYGDSARFGEFRRISETIRFKRREGLVGRVWASRKPEWLPDLSRADPGKAAQIDSARKAGKTACIGVPIVDSGNRVLAVMTFLASRVVSIDALLVDVVVSACAQLGIHFERKITAEAHRESEEKLRLLLDSTAEAIYGIDNGGNCTFVNDACLHMLGYGSAKDMIGKDVHELIVHSRADGSPYLRGDCGIYRAYLAGEKIHGDGDVFWRADGSCFPVEYWSRPVMRDATIVGAVVAFLDISERKAHEAKIERLTRIHRVLSGINSMIVRVIDRESLFRQACSLAVNEGKLAYAWIGLVEPGSTAIRPFVSSGKDDRFLDAIRHSLESGAAGRRGAWAKALKGEVCVLNRMEGDAEVVFRSQLLTSDYKAAVLLPLLLEKKVTGIFAIYSHTENTFDREELELLTEVQQDISFALGHLTTAARAQYLALHDELSGLPNRALFHDRLTQDLQYAKETGSRIAVSAISLRRLRYINESYGRRVGDQLIRLVAERLRKTLGKRDTVARISGDLFAVIRVGVGGTTDLRRRIEAEEEVCFGVPFVIAHHRERVSANSGVAVSPGDGGTAGVLLNNAEAALRKAKELKEPHYFYSRKLNDRVKEAHALENKLRVALEMEQFVLHYQAKVSSTDRSIVGCEALIRWNDPETGLVPPGRFIPLLEENGLILEVGRWALGRAAADFSALHAMGLKPPRIAVNASMIQLRRKGFEEDVKRSISQMGMAPGLDVEITESVIMTDIEATIGMLHRIRDLGARIVIDDFGTGYSSLRYLSKLPIHTVKIDRSFIMAMEQSADDMAIVSSIMSLAHSLNLNVVAEGVETEAQAKLLRLLRCDELQGYLFYKPIPFADFQRLLGASGGSALQADGPGA